MEISHFSHEHPLVLSEEKISYTIPCRICYHYIFGLSYCCQVCRYSLHLWCVELPRELSCPKLHKEHNLTLHNPHPNQVKCDVCAIKIEGFVYSCRQASVGCSFNLHVYCAYYQNPFTFEVLGDKPKLNLYVPKHGQIIDPCFVCGYDNRIPVLITEGKDKHCHFQCVMFPRSVKHVQHQHVIHLRPPPFGEKEYTEFFCDFCEKEGDPNAFVYSCSACELNAHIGCGISGSDRPIQDILGTNPVYKVSEDEEWEDYKKTEELELELYSSDYFHAAEEIEETGLLLEHLRHKNPLDILKFPRSIKQSCFLCLSNFRITSSCKDCPFLVHKRCAKLPKEINHWIHPDHGALKILQADDLWCDFCPTDKRSKISFFGCDKCDFKLDLHCALLPNDLNHPSHEHTLTAVELWQMASGSSEDGHQIERKLPLMKRLAFCQACGFICRGLTLMCDSCDFYLHVFCFILPLTGKHTNHRHDLSLTYSFKEDPKALKFMVCNSCEKPTIPNRWVYHCPDPECNIVSHVECVVPDIHTTYKPPNKNIDEGLIYD